MTTRESYRKFRASQPVTATTKPATPLPCGPRDFVNRFPKYVYRSHKGAETVQWKQAALDMYEDRARLVEALHAVLDIVEPFGPRITPAENVDRPVVTAARALLAKLGEDKP